MFSVIIIKLDLFKNYYFNLPLSKNIYYLMSINLNHVKNKYIYNYAS